MVTFSADRTVPLRLRDVQIATLSIGQLDFGRNIVILGFDEVGVLFQFETGHGFDGDVSQDRHRMNFDGTGKGIVKVQLRPSQVGNPRVGRLVRDTNRFSLDNNCSQADESEIPPTAVQ